MASAVSVPISGELAERLRAGSEASEQPPPVLAVRFYEAYPDEIDAKIDDNSAAAKLIDEMIAERERAVARGEVVQRFKPQHDVAQPA